jgi:hypothetical protein
MEKLCSSINVAVFIIIFPKRTYNIKRNFTICIFRYFFAAFGNVEVSSLDNRWWCYYLFLLCCRLLVLFTTEQGKTEQ